MVGAPLAYALTRFLGTGLGSIWISIVLSGGVATVIARLWLQAHLKAEGRPEEAAGQG